MTADTTPLSIFAAGDCVSQLHSSPEWIGIRTHLLTKVKFHRLWLWSSKSFSCYVMAEEMIQRPRIKTIGLLCFHHLHLHTQSEIYIDLQEASPRVHFVKQHPRITIAHSCCLWNAKFKDKNNASHYLCWGSFDT